MDPTVDQRLPASVASWLTAERCSLVQRSVLALCSGGVDSVALVDVLAHLPRGSRPAQIVVLHLDHGLRADVADLEAAETEAAAASQAAERHNLAFVVQHAEPGTLAGSDVQARAREWRYEIAAQVAQEHGCDLVATGHNADDQLETMLLGAIGSGGLRALSGMRLQRPLGDDANDLKLVRPLLRTSRAEIGAYAAVRGLTWGEDPSNAQTDRYRRNQLRRDVVPRLLEMHDGAGANLVRTSAAARDAADTIKALADIALGSMRSRHLDVRQLAQFPTSARYAVIAAWLRRSSDIGRSLTTQLIRDIDALALHPARAGSCSRVELPGPGACVRRDGYYLMHVPAYTTETETVLA